MNTSIKCLIFACVALLSFACSRTEIDPSTMSPEGVEITITADREEYDPDTRTVLESDGSVEWSPNDEISVFYGNGINGGSKFTAQNTEQAAIAEFKGRLEGLHAGGEIFTEGKYLYGVYPYSANTTFNNDTTTISLPANQIAKEGTFEKGLFPTIARAQGVNLAFYNICGGVKFIVSRDDITQIRFKGNNGERLAGKANVVFDESEKPAVLDDELEGKDEVTVYAPSGGTFEAGKEYFLVAYPTKLSSGFTMTFRTSDMKEGTYVRGTEVEIQRSVFGVLNQIDSTITSWTEITPNGGGFNSGIYLGIMGFNQTIYPYPIGELTDNSKPGFDSFIDDLNTMYGTVLYYSVDQAISTMQSVPLPTDISTVSIVTFTDGLDQGSIMLNESYLENTEYLNAVNSRIKNEKVTGSSITAYSIGIQGDDVIDVSMFEDNLEKLASEDEYATKVTSMDGVTQKFEEIAKTLSTSDIVQTITLKIPGLSNGTKVRFTFDNIESAEQSELFIEGTFNLITKSLENVKCEGLKLESETEIAGIEGVVDGIFVSITFDGVKTDNNKLIESQFIHEWLYIPSNNLWQINSEFDKNGSSEIEIKRSSALIMLVLDCSSSLGSEFPKVQSNAKNFINTLYGAVDDDSGETPDNAIYSTTPKDLHLSVCIDGTRYYLSKDEYSKANLSNAAVEGLCVLSGTEEEPFIVALKNANSNAMYWSIANALYDLPTYKQGVVISTRWTDINNALKAFGGNAITTTWTSGQYSSGSSYYYVNGSGGTLDWNSGGSYTYYVRQVLPINNLSIPWLQNPENDLTLAVTNGEIRLFIDKDEYLTNKVPDGYTIEGLAIRSRLGDFILSLTNASSDAMYHSSATSLYGDKLPTYNQGRVISARWTDINNALKAFGGNAITTTWTSGQYSSGSSYYYVNGSGGILDWNNGDSYSYHVRLVVDDDLNFSADTGGDGSGELPPGYDGWE